VVSFEDRQDLLGHRSGRITHQSLTELDNLTRAADRAYGQNSRKSPAPMMHKKTASDRSLAAFLET